MDVSRKKGKVWKETILTELTMLLDSWIAAFVLVVNNFERVSCRTNRWHGIVVCSRQHTVEAFSFIAFFFALVAAIFSFLTVYALTKESRGQELTHREKHNSHAEAEVNPETHVNNGLPSDNVV
jgi:hypothetical protein